MKRLTTSLSSVHGVLAEHYIDMLFAQKITKNKVVLDIASGEGCCFFIK
jgi:16S rRNA G527 N7-methylase RsmG